MNTPHRAQRSVAEAASQACKHRLGLFAKVLPPSSKFPASVGSPHEKRSSNRVGCVNNLVVESACADVEAIPAPRRRCPFIGNLLLNVGLYEKFPHFGLERKTHIMVFVGSNSSFASPLNLPARRYARCRGVAHNPPPAVIHNCHKIAAIVPFSPFTY